MFEENFAPQAPSTPRKHSSHRKSGTESTNRLSNSSDQPRSEAKDDGPSLRLDGEFSPGLRQAAEVETISPKHPVHVLKNVTRGMYAKLEEFIEQLTHRPAPGFGFRAVHQEPVRIDEMKIVSDNVIKVLNAIIFSTATDDLMVAVQDTAKDLKTSMQSYRLMLADPNFKGGVPEDRIGELIGNSVAFQRFIADPMTDLTSLAAGYQIQRDAA